jgi:hypothetical protein
VISFPFWFFSIFETHLSWGFKHLFPPQRAFVNSQKDCLLQPELFYELSVAKIDIWDKELLFLDFHFIAL